MNNRFRILPRLNFCLLFLLFSDNLLAQPASQPSVTGIRPVIHAALEEVPAVLERGPHHRVETWTERVTLEDGSTLDMPHTYTVLSTGMHWRESEADEWQDTVAEFVPVAGGFVASRGPHQVAVSDDLFVEGAVTVVSPEGVEWRSTPLSLAMRDGQGNVVVLAEARATPGVMVAPNAVLFQDAFDGIAADVRVIYTAAAVECDVVLRERLPDPALLGLDTATTEVVVLTEVYGSAPTAVERRSLTDAANRERTDATIRLGSLEMARGRAFGVEGAEPAQRREVPVFKELYEREGRMFLEEAARLDDLAPLLDTLPGASVPNPLNERWRRTASAATRVAPPARPARPAEFARRADGRFAIAAINGSSSFILPSLAAVRPGVVLDWTTINGSLTNYTFRSDTTYYVTNVVYLYGTPRFEGGTVVKFANTGSASLSVASTATLDWRGELSRPITLTAKDDNSTGESITGSTGNPSGTYAVTALEIGVGATTRTLEHLRVRHAGLAVAAWDAGYSLGTFLTLHNVQLVNCTEGVYLDNWSGSAEPVPVQNLLAVNVSTLFTEPYNVSLQAAFLTVDNTSDLWLNPLSATLLVKDSILHGVSGTTGATLNNNWSSSGVSPFETVGAGGHYLPSQSPVRGLVASQAIGSINAALTGTTTRAPQVLAGVFASNTTLRPWIGTDDQFTPGYHYAPLDFLAIGSTSTNASTVNANVTLTLQGSRDTGVRLGFAGRKGIKLLAGAKLVSLGDLTTQGWRLNQWSRANTVQELANVAVVTNSYLSFALVEMNANSELQGRWNDLSLLSQPANGRVLYSLTSTDGPAVSFRDTHLRQCQLTVAPADAGMHPSLALTNCVLESCTVTADTYYGDGSCSEVEFFVRNCLFRSGSLSLQPWSGACDDAWGLYDNLFEGVSFTLGTGAPGPNSHNAFTTATGFTGTSNRFSVVANWATTGPMGPYYYPASGGGTGLEQLLNAGSVANSANAGFYHYTTLAAGTREGTGALDIGFHYPATTGGLPTDTDSDGVPDLREDFNGNGVYNSIDGEGSHTDADGDWDGRSDFEELYLDGTDPGSFFHKGQSRHFWLRFDDGYVAEQGESPVENTGVVRAANWNGQGAWFTNSTARLRYKVLEANGTVNLPINGNGAIRFWFRPDWTPYPCTNTSPRNWSTLTNKMQLFELGGWRLSLSPGGTNLIFETRTNSTGIYGTNLIVSGITLPTGECGSIPTNRAWEISLLYGFWGTQIFLDGIQVGGTGPKPFNNPTAAERTAGFTIGNTAAGGLPAMGMIDEFEVFTGVHGEAYSQARTIRREHLAARLTNDTVYLDWTQAWTGTDIKRKVVSTGSETTRTTGVQDHHYTDTGLANATLYQYDVGGRKTYVGRNLPPAIYRGRLLVLIETNLFTWLPNELETFRQDLLGDGWQVVTNAVPRMDDAAWAGSYYNTTYTNQVHQIKQLIRTDWTNYPNDLKGVVLVGHVTVPYSGATAEDGHVFAGSADYHRGAWPADSYYGDLDGVWGDSTVNEVVPAFPPMPPAGVYRTNYLNNVPGDGKFDANTIPFVSGIAKKELFVGRIDFARMPSWSAVFTGSTNVEADLMRRYFVKNHAYRLKHRTYAPEAGYSVLDKDFTASFGAAMQVSSRLFGTDALDDYQRSPLSLSRPVLAAVTGGFGTDHSVQDWRTQVIQGSDFYTREIPAPLFIWRGSQFGDWNLQTNNFLKASLTGPEHGLAAVWLQQPLAVSEPSLYWRFDQLSLAEPLGNALLETLDGSRTNASARTHYVMGDPTVRLFQVAPPANLTHTTLNSTNVTLSWSGAFEPILGYWVFTSPNLNTPFTNRISPNLVSGTSFNYVGAGATGRYYQVRAVGLTTTAGTSVTNLSHGLIRYIP